MPWVRFTEDFDWSPKFGVTKAYKAGMTLLVTTRCANKAVEAKRAVKVAKPKAKAE